MKDEYHAILAKVTSYSSFIFHPSSFILSGIRTVRLFLEQLRAEKFIYLAFKAAR